MRNYVLASLVLLGLFLFRPTAIVAFIAWIFLSGYATGRAIK